VVDRAVRVQEGVAREHAVADGPVQQKPAWVLRELSGSIRSFCLQTDAADRTFRPKPDCTSSTLLQSENVKVVVNSAASNNRIKPAFQFE
jgi:hypothetical protein